MEKILLLVHLLGENEHLSLAYRGGAVISNNLFMKMNVGCASDFFQCWVAVD